MCVCVCVCACVRARARVCVCSTESIWPIDFLLLVCLRYIQLAGVSLKSCVTETSGAISLGVEGEGGRGKELGRG